MSNPATTPLFDATNRWNETLRELGTLNRAGRIARLTPAQDASLSRLLDRSLKQQKEIKAIRAAL